MLFIRDLIDEFDAMPKYTESAAVGNQPENVPKNRWPNFPAIDITRLRLPRRPAGTCDYINANYVR